LEEGKKRNPSWETRAEQFIWQEERRQTYEKVLTRSYKVAEKKSHFKCKKGKHERLERFKEVSLFRNDHLQVSDNVRGRRGLCH